MNKWTMETYAPVGKLTTFRLQISLAARNNWRIDHLDTVTAFLNPDVDDDTLFMELLTRGLARWLP